MNTEIVTGWKSVLAKYLALSQHDKVQVMYVWIDGTRQNLRAKSRTLDQVPKGPEDVPPWGYCGYGTYMSNSAKDSEMVMIPVAMYSDPFRGGNNKIVLCDTYEYNKLGQLKAHSSNKRAACKRLVEKTTKQEPWFGIEQEYTFLDLNWHPLGWPARGYPAPMGPYYCSVGAGKAIGRDILEAHYRAMLYSGLSVHGTNAEAIPSQWEFQLRPLGGLEASDQLWMARFMMHRIAEDFNVVVSFDPKPVSGNWNGAGVHVNISTKAMREEDGFSAIEDAVEKLEKRHKEHLQVYDPKGGEDNKRRLTGAFETAEMDKFSSGIGDRTTSVRIPREVALAKKGYLEDRRPAANCDPYEVIGALIKTICLSEE